MNSVERAVDRVLGALDDNLYRAKLQQRADPDWRTGNGESVDSMIAGYQRERDELVADAVRYGIKVDRPGSLGK